ncbi:hypothetical protein [Paenibacillus guangzhouensis]|uniref:hypothetical protein n=1 Tax=Paenibacillus guangzhouensis TaxID=1473112 RepID=UPI001266BCEF|nr:hypothetical protein [Paenibacillus guangzhouensis]
MKMTAFMIGGVLGAAAAVYLSNNKQMMMAKAGDMGHTVNDWMSKAKDKVIEVTLSPAFKEDASAASSTTTTSSYTSQAPSSFAMSAPSSSSTSSFASSTVSDTEFGSDLSSSSGSASSHAQLKDLINKSATVKREVDAILKENNTSL